MTNGDKIRSMTDEELAKWMCSVMTVERCDWTCQGGMFAQNTTDWISG